MPSPEPIEHFVTLFDNKFLVSGIALHASLMQQQTPFRLWIVCMDELVESQLERLALPFTTLIPLRELETAELLAIKPSRSRGEYCWTVTPFTFGAVFARDASVSRVTYLDADLFFYRQPDLLLREFTASGKDVLITDHAYDPEYDLTWKVGRFCVQFLTMRNTDGARKVAAWWQARCLEWCFARHEDGKFGDQKYLDTWTTLFRDEVHVLEQVHETLGPWNARMMLERTQGRPPVFYHFHGLRLTAPTRVVLYSGYRVGERGERLYATYLTALSEAAALVRRHGIPIPTLPPTSLRDRLKTLKNTLLRTHKSAALA